MNFAIQGNPPPWTVLGASGQKLFYTHFIHGEGEGEKGETLESQVFMSGN